ncbi:MAG: AAA family ATPase [Caldilineaceae bacterium]
MAYVPEFADLINQALARLDRSPSWLAQRIDVNPSTVSRWLNQGARPGDPEIVVRMADVLGLTGQVQELLAAAGYGYVEMPGQVSVGAASVTTTTLPSTNRTNLPAAVTPFLGRERELSELARLLTDPKLRLLSIVGPGGMGKTRLAVECARREREQFPDGACFVPLASLQELDDLLPAIAAALGYAFLTDARSPQQQLFDYLRAKALLLMLDNFEHLIDGAGLVQELLQAAPRLKVLVTSRERLRLSGETVFLLDGMDFPDWETAPDLNTYSAVSLFLQSARFARPGFTLQPDDLPYVVRLCRLVDGVPLGIVLAAAWVEMLSLPEITGEIERSLDFLSSDLRDLPERQRSLRAVFDHSWRLLTDNERSVFRQMAVFRGGFARQAAEEVVGAGLPLLTALLSKSLIQRTETGRYELHELVRQYAAEKLTLDPASPALYERHARYYLTLLHRQMDDLSGRQLQSRQGNVSADLDNIRAGWEWAVESREAMLISSALDDLCRFYDWQGRYAEGVAASQIAARMARSVG